MKITDHEFVNPCWCGCDGEDMLCHHYDENGHECLKPKLEHEIKIPVTNNNK